MKIVCPCCNKEFDLEESDVNNIISQIKNKTFEKEVSERVANETEVITTKSKLELSEQLNALSEQLSEKEGIIKQLEAEKKLNQKNLTLELEAQKHAIAQEYTETIHKLETELQMKDQEKELALEKLTSEAEKIKTAQKDEFEEKAKALQEQIDYYKDLKTKMSTKMIGETLEQHCEIEFNKLRATAFRNAYFEKDNEVSKATGSKGDYIFRDYDEDGNEIVSIMFEMKNGATCSTTSL